MVEYALLLVAILLRPPDVRDHSKGSTAATSAGSTLDN